MAGLYPDPPSWRMPIDRDGTVGFYIPVSGVVTQLTAPQMASINSESSSTVELALGQGIGYVGFIFPEPRDIDGWWLNLGTPGVGLTLGIEVSSDTTNGADGTWIQVATQAVGVGGVAPKPGFRAVLSASHLAQRGIRIKRPSNVTSVNVNVINLHLYGEPAPGANPDRLELWHPTLDEKLAPAALDWGDVPRSSSADRVFRVKNLSATRTAVDARVAMNVLTDGSPSVPGQHTLSYDGGTFLPQVNLGTLAPGAISAPVTLRRVTPSNAQLGLWVFRVIAEANSWS